jgi:hypothetical protein
VNDVMALRFYIRVQIHITRRYSSSFTPPWSSNFSALPSPLAPVASPPSSSKRRSLSNSSVSILPKRSTRPRHSSHTSPLARFHTSYALWPNSFHYSYGNRTGRRRLHPLREPSDMSLRRRQVPQSGNEARPHRCERQGAFRAGCLDRVLQLRPLLLQGRRRDGLQAVRATPSLVRVPRSSADACFIATVARPPTSLPSTPSSPRSPRNSTLTRSSSGNRSTLPEMFVPVPSWQPEFPF